RLVAMGSLLSPDFVTEGRAVIFSGKPGRGKTHLAIAVAYRAIQNGFDALFTTAAELIEELSAASRDGALRAALARYLRPHVLVVDEVGYLAYGPDAANVLFHVVDARHTRRRAMVFTTNKAPKTWGSVLHDDDLAEAIVDRILDRGRVLKLDGPSIRSRHVPEHELQDDDGAVRVSGKHRSDFPEPTKVNAGGSTAPRVGAGGSTSWTSTQRTGGYMACRHSEKLVAARRKVMSGEGMTYLNHPSGKTFGLFARDFLVDLTLPCRSENA
ncbi:MAG TPA: ATP-binding protein, partial [Polyangiaceae bacterium]|nr:ATP-binding protein [Polyangiaceae bacterium]